MESSPPQSGVPARPEQTGVPAVPEQRTAADRPASRPPARDGRRWSRFRAVLAVLAGMAALLCVGGLGIGYVMYDEATAPDRSAPDVVVSSYLRAQFVDRSDATAAVYTCSDPSDLAPILRFRDDIRAREQQHAISIRVSWGSLAVRQTGERSLVTTEIQRAVSDGSERDVQAWEFELVEENGWRVCGAEKLP